MNLHEFIQSVARALEKSARHAFNGAEQKGVAASLPNDWQQRLANQNNGITAAIHAPGTLRVDSPDKRFTLYLILATPGTPATSK